MLAAGQHEAVLTALADLAYLEERCRLSVNGLVEDLFHLLRSAPSPLPADASVLHASGARIDRRAITVLETLLFVHGERLTREPDQLFSVLHDELYWRGWWDNEYPSGPDELSCETPSGEVFSQRYKAVTSSCSGGGASSERHHFAPAARKIASRSCVGCSRL